MDRREFLQGVGATAAALSIPATLRAADLAAKKSDLAKVYSEVEKRHDEAVRRLQDWIRQPSIAAENRGVSEGCDMLIRLLKDPDETVRCQAAEALGQVGGAEGATVVALAELLQDASAPVKASAARALGALKKAAVGAVPALVRLLQDREESVRTAAAQKVGTAALHGRSARLTDYLVVPRYRVWASCDCVM